MLQIFILKQLLLKNNNEKKWEWIPQISTPNKDKHIENNSGT